MLKSGLILSLGLFAGRVLGLLREIIIAGSLGAGVSADIIIALITLPDLIIGLLLGNTLSVAFLTKVTALPKNALFGYFLKLSLVTFSIFSLLALFLTWRVEDLAFWLLPSNADSKAFISELLWVIWVTPLLALCAVSRMFLQAKNRFTLMGLEGVIFNICIIAGVLYFASENHLRIISIALAIGALLRWALQTGQVLSLVQKDFSGWPISLQITDLQKYGMALSTGLTLQILPFFGRSIASYFEQDGALSLFNYAYKFAEFPIALGTSVLAIVIFPNLAKLATDTDLRGHTGLFYKGHDAMISLTLPVSILAPPFLWLLGQRGLSFHQLSTTEVSLILSCISISLLFFVVRGLNDLYVTTLNSLGHVGLPMLATITGGTIALLLIYTMTRTWGLIGTFWGLNIGYLAMFLINLFSISRIMHQNDEAPAYLFRAQLRPFAILVTSALALFLLSSEIPTPALIVVWSLGIFFAFLVLAKPQLRGAS